MNTTVTIEELVKKFQAAEKAISLVRGSFLLFVLAERDEAPGKWDLLVSAEWLEINRNGIDQMVDALKPYLEPTDWRHLASITPLSPSMKYVQWIAQKYGFQHEVLEVANTFWDGVFVSHAFLITADKSPAPAALELAAA